MCIICTDEFYVFYDFDLALTNTVIHFPIDFTFQCCNFFSYIDHNTCFHGKIKNIYIYTG